MKTVIYIRHDFRIVEIRDNDFELDNLKGDSFNATINKDINPITLHNQEQGFEYKVYNEGVYGYVLEKWDGHIDKGWAHVDSCWGFVGKHSETNSHYIVEELKDLARSEG